MTNPFPIGTITITAGTPINLGIALAAAAVPARVRTLALKSLASNASPIYVGNSAAMVKATLAGCIDTIVAGERYVVGGFHQVDEIAWKDFWVDGDGSGDVLLISGQTV